MKNMCTIIITGESVNSNQAFAIHENKKIDRADKNIINFSCFVLYRQLEQEGNIYES